MKKNLLLGAAILMTGLSAMAAADKYTVEYIPEGGDGQNTYLLKNMDTGVTLDSIVAPGGEKVVFKGEVADALPGIITVNGKTASFIIVEPGHLIVNDAEGKAGGTMYNDMLQVINTRAAAIATRYRSAQTDEERESIYAEYQKLMKDETFNNGDNPLGYILFISNASSMEPEDIMALVNKYSSLKDYQRVQKLVTGAENKLATGVGKKYRDFTITAEDGSSQTLSQYLKEGRYLLVDFWASWCGPCRRQIPVIKELYNEYHDKGLDVLGVAVWDDPDDTVEAIEAEGITWPCILDAQRIPTDLYGIPGIPCIILIGPDGTILSRDQQGDELKAEVSAAIAAGL